MVARNTVTRNNRRSEAKWGCYMDGAWAWAAGLFEGEGSIVTGRKGRLVQLWLRTTDLDVLQRFAEIVGAGNITVVKLRPCHTKQQYSWCIGDVQNVGRILTYMRPWLGTRRGVRADEGLEFLRARGWSPSFSPARAD